MEFMDKATETSPSEQGSLLTDIITQKTRTKTKAKKPAHLNAREKAGRSVKVNAKADIRIEPHFTAGIPGDPLASVQYVKSTRKSKTRTVALSSQCGCRSSCGLEPACGRYLWCRNTFARQEFRRRARDLYKASDPPSGAHDSRGRREGWIFSGHGRRVFRKRAFFLLVHQMGAFNSPVWFNLGLYQEYGIEGSGGNLRLGSGRDAREGNEHSYSRPQCSACFIQSVDDDLMSIFQLMKNEARLFKYGSGTGTNFSKVRGEQEKLSGGGLHRAFMSFLEVLDRGAGATKSGGTTRRAAKMVCLDMDHPEIANFITWKQREEKKVAALIAAGYSSDFNGEAYRTVAGQNSNNSVRVTDEFMRRLEEGGMADQNAHRPAGRRYL